MKSSSDTTKSQKRGDGAGHPVMVRLSDDLLARLDDFRRSADDMPSRPEAIRRLVEKSLAASA